MKVLQIVPREDVRLYGELVRKEAAIRGAGRGTFYRAGAKRRDAAKWRHKAHKGWVNLQRGLSEVVTAEVHAVSDAQDWQMLSAFLGFVDRHFGDEILAITIHYR
ncbi:MAG TPA: hypothetical protein VMU06_21305 [Stellaceae bacterium]|jgi:hypothetical protein|nr:hypothetical protein [Stellaceae bacterium]